MKPIIKTLDVYNDERGMFLELYKCNDMVQTNLAYRKYGVICGLHYQLHPFEQAKVVTVIQGEILDVVVDLKTKEVRTYRLSDVNRKQIYIPVGYAHGYAVLSSHAIIMYQCSAYYCKKLERKIHYDSLGIDWIIPENVRIISPKDKL